MLGSNRERYGYDNRLSLDTVLQYGSSHTEFKSAPTSKMQTHSVGDRDLQAATEQLDKNASRKTAGLYVTVLQL